MKKTNKLILGILISVLSLSAAYLVYLVGFNRGEKSYNKFGLNAGELAAALRADKKYFAFTGNVKDISLPEKTIFLAISANNETTEIKTTEGTMFSSELESKEISLEEIANGDRISVFSELDKYGDLVAVSVYLYSENQ